MMGRKGKNIVHDVLYKNNLNHTLVDPQKNPAGCSVHQLVQKHTLDPVSHKQSQAEHLKRGKNTKNFGLEFKLNEFISSSGNQGNNLYNKKKSHYNLVEKLT